MSTTSGVAILIHDIITERHNIIWLYNDLKKTNNYEQKITTKDQPKALKHEQSPGSKNTAKIKQPAIPSPVGWLKSITK